MKYWASPALKHFPPPFYPRVSFFGSSRQRVGTTRPERKTQPPRNLKKAMGAALYIDAKPETVYKRRKRYRRIARPRIKIDRREQDNRPYCSSPLDTQKRTPSRTAFLDRPSPYGRHRMRGRRNPPTHKARPIALDRYRLPRAVVRNSGRRPQPAPKVV